MAKMEIRVWVWDFAALSLSMFSLTRIVWEREGVNVNESFSKFWGRSVG